MLNIMKSSIIDYFESNNIISNALSMVISVSKRTFSSNICFLISQIGSIFVEILLRFLPLKCCLNILLIRLKFDVD